MTVADRILMRMFGRPEGLLGRIGGVILARANRTFAQEVISFLNVRASEQVLEVGFGPGVAIDLLARAAPQGRVAGIDPSEEMVGQATARNAAAIRSGVVDLRRGTVERMPFEASAFDVVLAINSMQVWPDVDTGLREIRRVLRPGGRIALAFTPRSGQPRTGVTERLGGVRRLRRGAPGGAARRFLRIGPQGLMASAQPGSVPANRFGSPPEPGAYRQGTAPVPFVAANAQSSVHRVHPKGD